MPDITVPLRNPAVLRAAQSLLEAPVVGSAQLGALLASFSSSAAGAAIDALKLGRLPPDQLLPMAKSTIEAAGGLADLTSLLGDPALLAKLDANSVNFLKAVAGLEPLRMGGVFVAGAGAVLNVTSKQVEAVEKLRGWIQAGKLDAYYAAAIDLATPANDLSNMKTPWSRPKVIAAADPALKAEALEVFNNLPTIGPDTRAEDLVAAKLWSVAPRGYAEMQQSARYMPGRQIKVVTQVQADLPDGDTRKYTKEEKNFMVFNAAGPTGITSRATLMGEQGDNFLVQVEGKKKGDLISVPKAQIFEHNHPHGYSQQAGYGDPFMKAKMCQAAILMADDVAKLDFTKVMTTTTNRTGRKAASEQMVDVQMRCFKHIHDVINMNYYGDGNDHPQRVSGRAGNSGRAAILGSGVCTQQREVMRDLAFPFAALLGFDLRSVTGGVHRDTDAAAPMDRQLRSFANGGHDWLEVTFRPTMTMTVCDRTWQQCNMSLFEAYGPNGDRYPTNKAWGAAMLPVADVDVSMDGSFTASSYDKQFGKKGDSGRGNHMTRVTRTDA
jgi:hypothetical protein